MKAFESNIVETVWLLVGISIQLKFAIFPEMKHTSKVNFTSIKIYCGLFDRFPVDRWLDINEGDKRISLDLEPNKKPGQLGGKIEVI